ncbi:type VI secretion system-associated FHA domain protein TagH [Qingshengfaniella alkalisoli]|uniref:Type VI secretion system-associated FHA domain protein TagH n=1 Tax=Qingshengfaniella alkalisoli TaxID=2599296 RepID=A0A5B8IA40_9RHOB|nr:type VI secretion system-associated FHA domain protein TagH [Qingshengfaniella alkalisoli]QDY70919.1 type VI secretion system-associated FHA domain protein TagH [Qingshengfaniella alkalisoli]
MTVELRFQSTGSVPGAGEPVSMRGTSLTIGRGDDNDLVLPDPDRMISKNHCVVEDHNGNIVVIDLSTNGTFLNYGKIPLGQTPTPLNDGDVLSVGAYELAVRIVSAAPADYPPPPADDAPVSHGSAERADDGRSLLDMPDREGDFLDDLLGSDGPTGPRQIKTDDPMDSLLPPLGDEDDDPLAPPEEEHRGDTFAQHNPSQSDSFQPPRQSGNFIPEDWDADMMSSPPPPETIPLPPKASDEAVEPDADDPFVEPPKAPPPPGPAPPPPEPAARPEPEAPPPIATAPRTTGSARAFLDALDDDQLDVPDDQLDDTMARVGKAFRAMVVGLREILMTRTSIKSEFRIEQTMIRSGGNNPLKFSISPEQAIEAMVRPRSKGYLSAEEAAQQALDDIKAHEIAMVTGMEAALKGVLKKLDPKVLEDTITGNGGLGGLLKGKKARYWEQYEKLYGQISDQAENEFHELFSREFARAYKEQLEKLK